MALILFLSTVTKNLNVGILYQDEKAARSNGRDLQDFFIEHGKSVGVSIDSKSASITDFNIKPSNTHIYVDTAGAANPFRSKRLNFVLASEVGFWKDVGRALDSFKAAVNENGIVIYESSPSIAGVSFKKLYNDAKQEQESRKIKKIKIDNENVKPFFYSFLDFDKYDKIPPRGWVPKPDDIEFSRKYNATESQTYFRRYKLGENPDTDKHNYFKTNFPIDDVSCFESSGSSSAFDIEKLNLFKLEAPANILEKRYKDTAIKAYTDSAFRLFEPYNERRRYFIGVDTAKGEGGDENAAVVISVNNGGDRLGRIAAIYSSNSVSFTDFHRIIGNISIYYGNAHILIESNTYGDAVIHLLKQVHTRGRIQSLFTSMKSKEKTISNIEHYILQCNMDKKDDRYKLKDEQLIQQLKIFSTDKKEAKHQVDDLVIAFGLALESKKRNFDKGQDSFAMSYNPEDGTWSSASRSK